MSDSAPPGAPGPAGEEGPPREVRHRRRSRRAAVAVVSRALFVVAGLVAAYYLLPLQDRDTDLTSAALALGLLAAVALFGWEVAVIARSPHPRLKAVEALAVTLPLFLLLFAVAYFLLDRSAPGSFNEPLTRTDALYFALTTFATVGYGDIVARSQAGRVLTMLQMAGGLLFVGVAARVLTQAIETGLRRRHDR